MQLATGAAVAVVSWLAFHWVGLGQAAIWGIAAGVVNSIPYVGPLVVTVGVALVAFLQFGTLEMALLVAGIATAVTSLEGFLLTPWLVGRAARMNAVAVFVSLLAWGWLWGGIGLLLAVPLTMAAKVVCDRVEGLRPVGEMLGD